MRGRSRLAAPAPVRGWARIRAAIVIVASVATVVGLAPAASAAYAVEPVGPSWVPNGGVHSVVSDGATVYVGGSFTGGVAALDANTGALRWLGSADADVRALALNGGQLLLGGAFTTVGGTKHRSLASVNAATGAVNPTFKGVAGGTVRDIVVVGGIAYFGGAFTNHGGMAQQGLGAVDSATGALVTTFTPTTNGPVYALGTNGSRLFFGGSFTTVNGLPRNQLASVTLPAGSLDTWLPARPCTSCNVIWDMAVDTARNRVYTVGRNAGTLFTADLTSGATVFRNVGTVNGDSQAVTLAPDGRVYVGGHFVTVAGQTRMLVAEFDVSGRTPVLGAFSTRFVTSYPGVWALASTTNQLYVGGDFTAAGSKVNNQNKYPYFAIFPSTSIDSTPPTVTTTTPAAGATGVAATTDVTATFSEPVQGVDTTTFTLSAGGVPVDATVTQGTGNQWILNPTSDLTGGTTYTATLTGGTGPTGIRDMAGNALSPNPTTWTFTTADTTPPTATTVPTDGTSGVAVSADVTATFSEPVQGVDGTTFTLATGGVPVDATVTKGTGNQWILNPTSDLAAGTTYTATLTGGTGPTGVRDMANNALSPNPQTWTFTTAPADTTPPTVTAISPADGATGVAANADVTATFSEPVQGVDTTTFTLATGGVPVDATVTLGTGNQWILNPTADLAAGTTYTATLTGGTGPGIRDLANNALSPNPQTWTFTTAAAPTDTTPPTWTGRIPSANNATGVSRTANITVTFSEPVQNVTTTTFTLVPTGGGTPVPATVTFNATNGRWVLNPSATLPANTQFTATVTSDVTDLANNHFAGMTWNFTTGA